MRRILLTIEYNGIPYKGWQIQKNQPSVQQEITDALEKVCGHKINLVASGRTDEGVHALGQAAHFDTSCTLPEDKFPEALNILLPDNIKIQKSREVPPDFHARYDVKKKTYIYKMYNSRIKSPLRKDFYAQVSFSLNVENMKKACVYLLGEHDFSAFMASGREVASPVRTIYNAFITASGDEIYFEISGNGFLYNMVRIIAGTLIDIGRGRFAPEDMEKIIESRDRSRAGKTAPPYGLYLKSVEY